MYKKTAICTDVHWGRNNTTHNTDCEEFIDWFIQQVRQHDCDSIAMLGDWNDDRSSIFVETAQRAWTAAIKLSNLNLPVYWVQGNHDAVYKVGRREITSLFAYSALPNFTLITEPLFVPELGGGVLFSPFIQHDEYAPLYEKYRTAPVWMGHFEFRGFVITGQTIVMPSGPIHDHFTEPKAILSGHFHKRQAGGNVQYIGNVFGMTYSDAGDPERGMTIFDHNTNTCEFIAWPDQPHFTRIKMSELLALTDYSKLLLPKNRIQCLVDIPISYEESIEVKQAFMTMDQAKVLGIREFVLEETMGLRQALSETIPESIAIGETSSIQELVLKLLPEIKSTEIDNTILVSIFEDLIKEYVCQP